MPGLADCPPHDGVVDALRGFSARGVRQFILSAMEGRLLRSAIEHLGTSGFFDALYGPAHRTGDSKIGRELLNHRGIATRTASLIGDTDHDAEAADALGLSWNPLHGGTRARRGFRRRAVRPAAASGSVTRPSFGFRVNRSRFE